MNFVNTQKLTNKAYISGFAGLITINLMGYFYYLFDVTKKGWALFGFKFAKPGASSILFVLLVTGMVMILIELFIRYRVEGKENFININSSLKEKKYVVYFLELIYYIATSIIFIWLAKQFYQYAAHYTYGHKGGKYGGWFIVLNHIWQYTLVGMPVYIILTRTFQQNKAYDTREPVYLFWKTIFFLLLKVGLKKVMPNFISQYFFSKKVEMTREDGQILLGIFVKMFYIPLMTIFFIDQFSSMVKNYSYLADNFDPSKAKYNFYSGILDFYNICFTYVFVIDVGLAWCGYVFSSRWLKNGLKSVEPTFQGWAVALLCYPPFNHFLFIYFMMPSDKDFLTLAKDGSTPVQVFVLTLAILSLISYLIYMSATVLFGLRFSNLTNRGIIRTGLYKYIRHPAYAGKNIAWWLVFLPYIIYQALSKGSFVPLLQIIALVMMTTLYFYRAITEERHLLQDPEYQEYMGKVKYRFIPGIF